MDIRQATRAYELWLSKQMPLIPADLRLKHHRMAQSAFAFLRATVYRWTQLWPEVCPELATAPAVLGVSDLHVDNFGTWRDSEGRLVWGINDFDEACQIPYPVDLVRLAVSAQFAAREEHLSCDLATICEAILTGYRESIEQGGKPFVLAEHHGWLRDLALSNLRNPVTFWQKFGRLRSLGKAVPLKVKEMLLQALPESGLAFRVVHRQAGLGSLGRRRFAVLAECRGGLVAREAKELAPSAWNWQMGAHSRNKLFYMEAIERAVRLPDPFVRLKGRWVVRRLAPDCCRIELGAIPKPNDPLKLFYAMGWETANIHLGTEAAVGRLLKDLNQRLGKWLRRTAEAMARATLEDWKRWAES